MTDRFVTVGDALTLPPAVKVLDGNLPATSNKAALDGKVDDAQVGAASGVAPLDSGSKLPEAHIPARLSDASLNATYATVLTSNGTADQSARINAALSAAATFGVRRSVKLVGDFNISSTLVVFPDTTLDATQATVTLIAGSNVTLIKNRSVNTIQRTITGSAITAGAAILTSATAAFTSADVGRSVVIAGAGYLGGNWTSTIVSVTDASTAVLAKNAPSTASNASTKVYDRDKNIHVFGGVWDHGTVVSAVDPLDLHITRWRRIDGLRLHDMRIKSLGGKYGFNIADCNRYWVENMDLDTDSDGVHCTGPVTEGTIRGIKGTTGDDTVAFGCGDYLDYQDVTGDIENILIEDIQATSGFAPVKIFNSTTMHTIKRLTIRGITGKTTGSCIVNLGSTDASNTANIEEVLVENITGIPAAGGSLVLLQGTGFGDVTCRDLKIKDSTTAAGIIANAYAVVETLRVQGISCRLGSTNRLVSIPTGAIIRTLVIDGADNVAKADYSGGQVLNVAGTVTRATLTNIVQKGGDAVVSIGSGGSVPTMSIRGLDITTGYIGVALGTANYCDLQIDDAKYDLTGQLVRFNSTGSATIRWGKLNRANGAMVGRSGTQTFRSINAPALGSGLDLSWTVSQQNGDMNYNHNAALACGQGICLYNGTTWKNLYSGLTYP